MVERVDMITIDKLKDEDFVDSLRKLWGGDAPDPCHRCGGKMSLGGIGGRGPMEYYCPALECEGSLQKVRSGSPLALDLLEITLSLLDLYDNYHCDVCGDYGYVRWYDTDYITEPDPNTGELMDFPYEVELTDSCPENCIFSRGL